MRRIVPDPVEELRQQNEGGARAADGDELVDIHEAEAPRWWDDRWGDGLPAADEAICEHAAEDWEKPAKGHEISEVRESAAETRGIACGGDAGGVG